MKKTDIRVGETYTNGRLGRLRSERKILAAGDFLLYAGQTDNDCLKYEIVAGPEKGAIRHITRTSFASWAKYRVGDEPQTAPPTFAIDDRVQDSRNKKHVGTIKKVSKSKETAWVLWDHEIERRSPELTRVNVSFLNHA